MIDRWLMGREGKSTVKVIETQQITASNHKELSIGSKVTNVCSDLENLYNLTGL